MQYQPLRAYPSRRVAQRGRALSVTLADLDTLPGDGLGLFCWTDVRPLVGVCGLVDWRLCGALSVALQANIVTGAIGDVLMMPASARLMRRRVFLFGLGDSNHWAPSVLERGCAHAVDVMRRAGVQHIALGAPASRTIDDMQSIFVHVCTPKVHRDLTLLVS